MTLSLVVCSVGFFRRLCRCFLLGNLADFASFFLPFLRLVLALLLATASVNLAGTLTGLVTGFRLGRRFSSLFFGSRSRFGWRFRLNTFHLRLLLILGNRQVNFHFSFLLRRSGLARRSQGYAFAVHPARLAELTAFSFAAFSS